MSFIKYEPLFYILIVLAIAVAIKAIASIVKKTLNNYVIKHSSAIKDLEILNSKYKKSFKKLEESYSFTKKFNYKQSFDRAQFDKLFLQLIQCDEKFFRKNLENLEINKKGKPLYNKKCKEIFAERNTEWYKLINFEKIELALFNKNTLKPVTDFSVVIKKTYTSPAGRNSYSSEASICVSELKDFLNTIEQIELHKQSNEYQRSLMTDSLRYDILKRDGFRCVLCGATPEEDGIKLHVDHIIPVSKGGKTTKKNLRTLCDRCNLGKRDKYDSDGLN